MRSGGGSVASAELLTVLKVMSFAVRFLEVAARSRMLSMVSQRCERVASHRKGRLFQSSILLNLLESYCSGSPEMLRQGPRGSSTLA